METSSLTDREIVHSEFSKYIARIWSPDTHPHLKNFPKVEYYISSEKPDILLAVVKLVREPIMHERSPVEVVTRTYYAANIHDRQKGYVSFDAITDIELQRPIGDKSFYVHKLKQQNVESRSHFELTLTRNNNNSSLEGYKYLDGVESQRAINFSRDIGERIHHLSFSAKRPNSTEQKLEIANDYLRSFGWKGPFMGDIKAGKYPEQSDGRTYARYGYDEQENVFILESGILTEDGNRWLDLIRVQERVDPFPVIHEEIAKKSPELLKDPYNISSSSDHRWLSFHIPSLMGVDWDSQFQDPQYDFIK